jgi:integrase
MTGRPVTVISGARLSGACLNGVVGYLSGWRRSKIVTLKWEAVDRAAREVRLYTSKNGQGRVLPLHGDLWDLFERRWTARTIQMKDGTTKLSQFVFHRAGEPVVDFRKPWKEACLKAKISGRLFHDLRRTAVRNKTVSMFMR